MPQVDMTRFNFFGSRAVQDAQGNVVADLMDSKAGDEVLVEPRSGSNIRNTAALTIEVAKAYPDKKVGFDHSSYYYAVSAGDTLTEVMIRYMDEPAFGRTTPPGEVLNKRETGYEVRTDQQRIQLFDAVIDAIRLSRAEGGAPVEFSFNGHKLSVYGNTDAEEMERMVPAQDRVANVPPPPPKTYTAPEPVEKIGGFTVRGLKR